MEGAHGWKNLFSNWPQAVPRQGMLVTTFGETINFTDFLVSPAILIVERDRPDTYGARKVMVAYEAISAVKHASPEPLATFKDLGFEGPG